MGRVKLKLGELNARMLCQFTAFGDVVDGVFGGKKDDGDQPLIKGEYTDLTQAPSFEHALANINAALSYG